MKQISIHSVTEMAGGVTAAAAAGTSEITRDERERKMHFTAACDSRALFHSP